jgi:hypothetical protein
LRKEFFVPFTDVEKSFIDLFEFESYEQKAIIKLMTRFDSDIDESSRYVGYFVLVKTFGTLVFRIVHSRNTWVKLRRILKEVDIDITSYSERTVVGNRVRALSLFDKAHPTVRDLWAVLQAIDRRAPDAQKARVFSDDLHHSSIG